MPKVLFTHSYFYRFDPKQWRNQQPYPPYGTIYAAAVMRECGCEVALHDTNLSHHENEIIPVLDREKPHYLVIYDDGFNYLTKMCLTRMREAAFEMAKYGKQRGCVVIVCSSDSTDHYEQYLSEGCDIVIQGEGEITLRELVVEIEKSRTEGIEPNYSRIAGIAFKQQNQTVKTGPRSVATDLDAFPDPAWDLIDMEAYRRIWVAANGYFSLNMATTRGCPYKCNWCAKPIYGNRYNTRSPLRVAAEIELLVNTHGAQHFWMSDDIFGLKPQWVQEFRDELRRRNLRIRYKIQSRVDLLLKEDNIDALVDSGLEQVWVGAESGSQHILDAMDKGTQVEEIYEATRILKKKGVEVCFFLQFGYLGETREDIEKTIRMVEELAPHDIGVSVSYPLPGTKFYQKVKDLLGAKQNWSDSDDLAMMYPATFQPDFYRRLHRLVHKRFRLRQAQMAWQSIAAGHFSGQLYRALSMAYYWPGVLIDTWRLKRLEKPDSHDQPTTSAVPAV